jgi:heat shock protein HtpX
MDNLFSTHPAVENRIAQLQRLAGEMQTDRTGRRAEPNPGSTAAPRNSGWRVPPIGGSQGGSSQQRGPWG